MFFESGSEKRKFNRIKTHLPVRFKNLRDKVETPGKSSISVNISEGGIRFTSKDFIPMARRLILEIDIPMFEKPLRAISKVAWIKKREMSEGYEMGNQFLEISKLDKGLIAEYVKSLENYNDKGMSTLEAVNV